MRGGPWCGTMYKPYPSDNGIVWAAYPWTVQRSWMLPTIDELNVLRNIIRRAAEDRQIRDSAKLFVFPGNIPPKYLYELDWKNG